MTQTHNATLLVIGEGAVVGFTRTECLSGLYPCPIDATDLHTAALVASRLEPDSMGCAPLSLLRVHAPTEEFTVDSSARSIPFVRKARLLAGLIGDAVLAGVASGAVVSTRGDESARAELRDEIAAYLEAAGFGVALEIPGWTLSVAPTLREIRTA